MRIVSHQQQQPPPPSSRPPQQHRQTKLYTTMIFYVVVPSDILRSTCLCICVWLFVVVFVFSLGDHLFGELGRLRDRLTLRRLVTCVSGPVAEDGRLSLNGRTVGQVWELEIHAAMGRVQHHQGKRIVSPPPHPPDMAVGCWGVSTTRKTIFRMVSFCFVRILGVHFCVVCVLATNVCVCVCVWLTL